MIITIDGPAGSGKSTAARRLAEALGIAYLDSGATYRAVTLKAIRQGVDWNDTEDLMGVVREADVRLLPGASGLTVLLDGQDVTADIRSAEVSEHSHHVAGCEPARQVLMELQRRIGRELGDFVAEGRDQGSVVFPQADPKFYLDAAPEVRARRRYEDLLAAGEKAEYPAVLEALLRRDERDRGRAFSPLVKPPGAIEVDTTGKTIEQTLAGLLSHVREVAR